MSVEMSVSFIPDRASPWVHGPRIPLHWDLPPGCQLGDVIESIAFHPDDYPMCLVVKFTPPIMPGVSRTDEQEMAVRFLCKLGVLNVEDADFVKHGISSIAETMTAKNLLARISAPAVTNEQIQALRNTYRDGTVSDEVCRWFCDSAMGVSSTGHPDVQAHHRRWAERVSARRAYCDSLPTGEVSKISRSSL